MPHLRKTNIYRKQAMTIRPGSNAFTLVEIMVVVVIIGLLTSLAIPYYNKVRKNVLVNRFSNDMRVVSEAFQFYAFDNGIFPPDAQASNLPEGMDGYLRGFPWGLSTPIGGSWDWQNRDETRGIQVIGFTVADNDIEMIDERLDDGNLGKGSLTASGSNLFFALHD